MPKDQNQVTRRILVVGGAGYIGSRLVPELLGRGHDVTVVDTFWFGDWLPECKKRSMQAAELVERDLEGFDCLIWLAGLSNDPMANFSPEANFTDNASTPAYLAYIAQRAGVKRFIHGGSCSVYGYAADREHTEDSETSAVYPYGVAKLMAETGCRQQAGLGMSVILLRKGTVSGYSPRMRLDLIINTMVRDALLTGTINISNPRIWRPILWIDDAVQAYVRAVEATPDTSGVFNILTENATVLEVAARVAYVVSQSTGKNPAFNIAWKEDPRNYRVSGALAKDVLGFSPVGSIEHIAAHVVNWASGRTDLMDDRYYNIKIFEQVAAREFAATWPDKVD